MAIECVKRGCEVHGPLRVICWFPNRLLWFDSGFGFLNIRIQGATLESCDSGVEVLGAPGLDQNLITLFLLLCWELIDPRFLNSMQ
jgi:hypothetical protein